MKRALALCIAFACCAIAQAADLRPITHEDVWLAKRVSAPVPSPDGRWVVFTVAEPAYAEKDKRSDLWLVPADGSAPARRLTNSRGAESGVAWGEDSRRIVFSARRDDDTAAQIYLLDLGFGGEARRLTHAKEGARSPVLSPDGASLAYVSDVPNDPQAAEPKYNARVYDGFPVRSWDHWRKPQRPHLFVQPLTAAGEPAGEARDLLAGTQLAAAPGFAGRGGNSGDNLDPVWTRDSRQLVFVASENRNQAAYAFTDTQLYRVAAAGGSEPVRLTSGPDRYGSPMFSPDGRRLFAAFERGSGKPYNIDQIAALDWPEVGAPLVLTAPLDRPASSFAVSADGRTLWFLAADAGRHQLYSTPTHRAQPQLAWRLESGNYGSLALAAQSKSPVLVATWDSAIHPPEVVRLAPQARRHELLTGLNAALAAQIDWQPLREFTFENRRGDTIHSFMALPPGFDPAKKYPLLVLMHGGPHSMWTDQFVVRWNYHLLAQPGYIVLLTNYKGSTGYGEAFAQSIQGDPLRGPADDINAAADEAIKRFSFIDGTRQCAAGASYGGHLANWMQATATRMLLCAADGRDGRIAG